MPFNATYIPLKGMNRLKQLQDSPTYQPCPLSCLSSSHAVKSFASAVLKKSHIFIVPSSEHVANFKSETAKVMSLKKIR